MCERGDPLDNTNTRLGPPSVAGEENEACRETGGAPAAVGGAPPGAVRGQERDLHPPSRIGLFRRGYNGAVSGGRGLPGETVFLAGGALILASSFLYPYLRGWVERLSPGCLFRRLTGLPCLLCGMTRSFAAVSRGRLADAFRYHLLGPPLFFSVAAVTAGLALEQVTTRRILPRPDEDSARRLAKTGLALLVAAWVTRLLLFGVEV